MADNTSELETAARIMAIETCCGALLRRFPDVADLLVDIVNSPPEDGHPELAFLVTAPPGFTELFVRHVKLLCGHE